MILLVWDGTQKSILTSTPGDSGDTGLAYTLKNTTLNITWLNNPSRSLTFRQERARWADFGEDTMLVPLWKVECERWEGRLGGWLERSLTFIHLKDFSIEGPRFSIWKRKGLSSSDSLYGPNN